MKTTQGNIQFLVIGASVSTEMLSQLGRVKQFNGTIGAAPKVHKLLMESKVKSLDFTKNTEGVVIHEGYPKAGLPLNVMMRIVSHEVKKGQEVPFSIVVAEIEETAGVVTKGEPFSKVQEACHYNTVNGILAAARAGKIVCTTPKQVEQVLNLLEANGEITEAQYDQIATVYLEKATRAIASWMERIGASASSAYLAAKAKLEEINFFIKKPVTA